MIDLDKIDKELESISNKIAYYQMKERNLITKYNKIMDEGAEQE